MSAKSGGNENDEPYAVMEVPARACIDCGRQARFRVVDTRKKHGERYPGPLRCKPCAVLIASKTNATIAAMRSGGSAAVEATER